MAFNHDIAAHRPGHLRLAMRFAASFAAYRKEVRRRRERTRAMQQLRALDRHTLRDIAIDRSEIASVVNAPCNGRRRVREED